MKTRMMITLAAAAMWQAKAAVPTAERQAVVYLENQIEPGDGVLASVMADHMFAKAGLRIVWRTWSPTGAPATRERVIVVRFSSATAPTEHPGALAFALPYDGTRIEVFYDRIRAGYGRARQVVLAHVLVHEITHLLEGIARHSDSGVMKAHWSSEDYKIMNWRPLPFTAHDIELIQAGLEGRDRKRTLAW